MRAFAPWGMPALLLLSGMIVLGAAPLAGLLQAPPAVVTAGPYDCQGVTYSSLSGPEAIKNGGFESGFTDWDPWTSGLSISTTVVHSGTSSMKIDAEASKSTNTYQRLPALSSAYVLVHWFYLESMGPGGLWGIALIRNWDPSTGAGDDPITVLVHSADIEWLSWAVHGVSGVDQTVPFTLTQGAWHSLAVVADGARGVQCLYVDDAPIATASVDPALTFLPEHVVFGDLSWLGDAGIGYYDDLSILPLQAETANRPPEADAGGPYAGFEGSPIVFDASASTDSDGDNLAFRWDFQNDGAWDTGWSSSPFAAFTWGDDWAGAARVEVSDGQATDSATASAAVANVPPTIPDAQAYLLADVTLRVAGEKWHDVCMEILRAGTVEGRACVERRPGSPDDQAVTIENVTMDLFGGNLSAVVTYTPGDDPVNGQWNGANPVWLILNAKDGFGSRLHHTFNVRDEDTWVWRVDDLRALLAGTNLTFTATATDPGSDDLTFAWDFGDGVSLSTTYFNDGVGPDPYPSPEMNPITAADAVRHAFTLAGTYTVTLTVTDDDGGVAARTFDLRIGG